MKEFARTVLGLDIFLLLLLAISFPYLEQGTPTYLVAQISAGILLLSIVVVAIFLRQQTSPAHHGKGE